ncbi:RNA-directed DNA polymerase [Cryobacterium sp. Y11]|uniref:RNA-directed DNA polymerase n=1 Tax=Cryobacterium sp. Y11 TaxID=2045016 RepID=UPI001304DE8D|nr:RNA-directed DNA polymerase [Cryobacterium sp. Y11]
MRALVTECVPYELPLEMADHWLYEWMDERATTVSPKELRLHARNRFDLLLLALIGDVNFVGPIRYGEVVDARIAEFSPSWRAPASFRVRRDRSRTRELDLLSMRSQLNVAFLYYRQKDLLLHYANRDRASLRHPARVNEYGKHPLNKFRLGKSSQVVSVETSSRRLGSYNSYFVYDKYAFVGEYYDSREWHALEARWSFLRRLDVANCFRSIYTHSASWSTGTDFFSKQHLSGSGVKDLGQVLDKTMQAANWGETHGICVGPEFSRIFAEIVFQHLGIEIESQLRKLEIGRKTYEILRYVDDYFVFAADAVTLDRVSKVVETTLSEHKFAINPAKTRDYKTPFTTAISVKKANLKAFLRTALPYEGDLPSLDAREISVHLKALLVGTEDESATVGTSLSQIEKRLLKFVTKRAPRCDTKEDALELSAYIWSFVHDMLFQYLSHPSVASAMKVVKALRMYFQAPELLGISDSERPALQFRANEYVHFAINKAIERLIEVENADIEICHFLSLAGACEIQIAPSSKLTSLLMEKINRPVPRPKGNQALTFLLLSTVKFYLSDKNCPELLRKEIVGRCFVTGREILSRGYLPGAAVKRHAIQETFVLAISTCPFFSLEEKLRVLDQPWLLDLIQEAFFEKGKTYKSSTRFLRRCLREIDVAQDDSGAVRPSVFRWTNDQFDILLYEKQPQFIY